MKKILSILFVVPLIFSSCEKEDDSPNNTSGSILGTWELISGSYTETTTTFYIDPVYGTEVIVNTDRNENVYDYENVYDFYYSISYTFRYDSTYVRIMNHRDPITGYPDPDGWGDTTIYNYSKTGNILSMEPMKSLYGYDYIITTLNNNTLSISAYGRTESSNVDTTYRIDWHDEYTFSKSTNRINDNIESLKQKGNSSMFIPNTASERRRNVNR